MNNTFNQNDQDTIAAISTAIGPGGINIIRISGPDAIAVAESVFVSSSGTKLADKESHEVSFGRIIDPEDETELDEVLVSLFRKPRTYTREDVVEINCHGGAGAAMAVLDVVLAKNPTVRVAEPGEFTKRAFLGGRIDLAQAEAVEAIIKSKTEAGLKNAYRQLSGQLSSSVREIRESLLELRANLEASVDWPEEELVVMAAEQAKGVLAEAIGQVKRLLGNARRSRILQEGIVVAIVGRPNVGKSSILNFLAGHEKAIVTARPGTTRDIVEATVNIKGFPVILKDTAGIHATDDDVEKIGVERSRDMIQKAAISLLVLDGSNRITGEDREVAGELGSVNTVVLINKSDLGNRIDIEQAKALVGEAGAILFSAKTGQGLEELELLLEKMILAATTQDQEGGATNSSRHIASLKKAIETLGEAQDTVSRGDSEEVTSLLVREADTYLGEIVGENLSGALLDKIFATFCIGK